MALMDQKQHVNIHVKGVSTLNPCFEVCRKQCETVETLSNKNFFLEGQGKLQPICFISLSH